MGGLALLAGEGSIIQVVAGHVDVQTCKENEPSHSVFLTKSNKADIMKFHSLHLPLDKILQVAFLHLPSDTISLVALHLPSDKISHILC